VRLLHLGLGNFFRAHQAWYTEHSSDSHEWAYAAFAGRGADLAERMDRQHGRYTLVTRGPQADDYEVIESVARSHRADEDHAWLEYFRSPEVALVTLTVTEAGYVGSAPRRLVAGLDARRRADAGPFAVVPCDNIAGNGDVAERVVTELAERVDPALVEWIAGSVSFVSTTVDRITPRSTAADEAEVLAATGFPDACPVVTEPFAEWVLAGDFPAGRPQWEDAGATFTVDVTPYENRKLWLLNGAHSLLAYAGSLLGQVTVAEAIADEMCRDWVAQWWEVAAPHLAQSGDVVDAYCRAWANPRIRHLLAQIAADGSQKLPIRVLPVLRAERAVGRVPLAATRILAAWVCHLRGSGAPISDVRQDDALAAASGQLAEAVRRILDLLDPGLGSDDAVVQAVCGQVGELTTLVRP
jgi:fructuronate reductase